MKVEVCELTVLHYLFRSLSSTRSVLEERKFEVSHYTNGPASATINRKAIKRENRIQSTNSLITCAEITLKVSPQLMALHSHSMVDGGFELIS